MLQVWAARLSEEVTRIDSVEGAPEQSDVMVSAGVLAYSPESQTCVTGPLGAQPSISTLTGPALGNLWGT